MRSTFNPRTHADLGAAAPDSLGPSTITPPCSAGLHPSCTGEAVDCDTLSAITDRDGDAACGECARVLVEWSGAIVRHDGESAWLASGTIAEYVAEARANGCES